MRIEPSVLTEFYASLKEATQRDATDSQKSKYKLEDLEIIQNEFVTVEEDLMGPDFCEPSSLTSEGLLQMHVEIKMKSSLDVLPTSGLDDFVETFMAGSSPSKQKAAFQTLEKSRDSRKGSETNQFFFRNIVAAAKKGKISEIEAERAKNDFDGIAFFVQGVEGRAEAIRKISGQDSNYFRVFDKDGNKLDFQGYSHILKAHFIDWSSTFCAILSESIKPKLLNTVLYMQRILGESIGSTVLRLVKLKYAEVKKEKGVSYLLTHSKQILEAIMECLEESNLSDIQSFPSQLHKIELKVKSKLASLPSSALEHLDLQIVYTCALTIMTFCDSSVILKAKVSLSPVCKLDPDSRSSTDKLSADGRVYHYSIKNTIIDIGAKKDDNLAKLVDTFYGLEAYVKHLNGD